MYSSQRPPLGIVDTVEGLEKLAKERLLKVANEGTSRGARLSTMGQTQRFFNQVRAVQASAANSDLSYPSQSRPAQGMDTARAVFWF